MIKKKNEIDRFSGGKNTINIRVWSATASVCDTGP